MLRFGKEANSIKINPVVETASLKLPFSLQRTRAKILGGRNRVRGSFGENCFINVAPVIPKSHSITLNGVTPVSPPGYSLENRYFIYSDVITIF